MVTPGRCGSEHLRETLNFFEDIYLDGEIFNRSNSEPGSFNWFLTKNPVHRFLAGIFNRERISGSELNLPLKWLINNFLSKIEEHNGAKRGFMISLDQLDSYPVLYNLIKTNKLQVIYLTRWDMLASVLSLIKARETRNYHVKSFQQKIAKYSFDPKKVAGQYLQTLGMERSFKIHFQKTQFLEVYYEDLFSNYQQAVGDIRSYLGLSQKPIAQFSEIVKSNPENLNDWVVNIVEIENEFNKIRTKI